ncbi:MAG TPA: hypothetical protein VNH42_01890 [Mariprofundaceae bacterium]|nr:hypothetical protein [Mariprofundaceae bacterium]
MTELVRFSYALSPRMQAFIELRNGLDCLDKAAQQQSAHAWLCAASDIRSSLTGDQGRKLALPEIVGLLVSMQAHLQSLAKDYPRYAQTIQKACERLDAHMQNLRGGLGGAIDWLYNDSLISTHLNALKKQDWLGHKPALPQCLGTLWHPDHERVVRLGRELDPLRQAIRSLDQMLHEYVGWSVRTAEEGCDQITPERGVNYGLLVIGLEQAMVEAGITPDISGNRVAVRVRFQQWPPGEAARDFTDTFDYSMMLVPFA